MTVSGLRVVRRILLCHGGSFVGHKDAEVVAHGLSLDAFTDSIIILAVVIFNAVLGVYQDNC